MRCRWQHGTRLIPTPTHWRIKCARKMYARDIVLMDAAAFRRGGVVFLDDSSSSLLYKNTHSTAQCRSRNAQFNEPDISSPTVDGVTVVVVHGGGDADVGQCAAVDIGPDNLHRLGIQFGLPSWLFKVCAVHLHPVSCWFVFRPERVQRLHAVCAGRLHAGAGVQRLSELRAGFLHCAPWIHIVYSVSE